MFKVEVYEFKNVDFIIVTKGNDFCVLDGTEIVFQMNYGDVKPLDIDQRNLVINQALEPLVEDVEDVKGGISWYDPSKEYRPLEFPEMKPPFIPREEWSGCFVCNRGADGKPDLYCCMRSDCPSKVRY